eukprot:gene13149-biopygen6470
MDQVLSVVVHIPGVDVESLMVCVDVAMDCAEQEVDSNPAAAGLTVDEIAAIKMYTMTVEPPSTSLYYLLNKALREKNRDNVKPFVKILWLLMQAMKKSQPYTRPVVYRGVKSNLSGQYRKKGQKVTWSAFTSTTTSLDVLSNDLFL